MMENRVKEVFDRLGAADDKIRLNALQTILGMTQEKVDWVYDVWDGLLL
jgi:hypothetical protein